MGDKSGIAWCDATLNVLTGCTRVSPGCERCYAEHLSGTRLAHLDQYGGVTRRTAHGPRWTGEIREQPNRLAQAMAWKRPRRIFLNSMSDTFHEKVSHAFTLRMFRMMEAAWWHDFLIVTKRAELMAMRVAALVDTYEWKRWPLPNVWLGVSAENQKCYDDRVLYLDHTPAAVRWVSFEPMLEPITLRGSRVIDWAVLGGESVQGDDARPCDVTWVRELVDECRALTIAPFVKQLGSCALDHSCGFGKNPRLMLRDRAGSDPQEWPEDLRVREYPRPHPTKVHNHATYDAYVGRTYE